MGIPMARSAELLKNPEFRAAMLEQQMFSLRRMYSDVGEALRLSPEEVDALFETLADHQLESMELAQEFLPRPGSAPDPDRVAEMQQRMAEIQRKQYEAIASRLGEARAQEWQQYLSTVPARWEVRELRAALAEAGEPLSSQQIEVLVDAIAQERRRPTSVAQNAPQSFSGPPSTRERIALLEQSFERIEQSNRRIREAVAPYLSPTQLAALERHQQQQLEMNRAGMRLSRLQRQALQQGGAIDATGAAVMGFVAVPVEPPADSSR
jgi:hypothetical protein